MITISQLYRVFSIVVKDTQKKGRKYKISLSRGEQVSFETSSSVFFFSWFMLFQTATLNLISTRQLTIEMFITAAEQFAV